MKWTPCGEEKNNNGNPPYNANPTSVVTNVSNKLYKLAGGSSNTTDKVGLGITLRVMSGDNVSIYGKSYWHNTGSTPTNTYSIPVNDLLALLAGTNVVSTAGKGATSGGLTGSSFIPTELNHWLADSVPTVSGKPKAYYNWVLFDEQFRLVSNSSGFHSVGSTSDVIDSFGLAVNITRNGYLYVYCSNESNIPVFFDNFQVTHDRGPLLEETHYYPFGLTMAGISSKAAGKLENRYKYNGNKLESGEFSDGSGLEMYDFNARTYDQQIGRFMQVDPEVEDEQESWTPYHFGFNNPILHNDPDGKNPGKGIIKLGGIILRIIRAEQKLDELKKVDIGDLIEAFSPITVDKASLAKSQASLHASIETSKEKAKGSNNEKTKESAKTGQEAHRQEEAKLKQEGAETEVTMQLKDGTVVRKDAVRPDGTTVIIKPNTKTGRASADKRADLMEKNGHKTEKIFYDPKDPKYQPGSPSYIGPKKPN